MKKYTTEQFSEYLNAFNEGNKILQNSSISFLTSGAIWSDLCSDIPDYMKKSLVRKILRHVAKTALQGTFEIDGLSVSQSFCAMNSGFPESFGTWERWTFHSKRLNKQITITIDTDDMVRYFDEDHILLMHAPLREIISAGDSISIKVDMVQHFEDARNHFNY